MLHIQAEVASCSTEVIRQSFVGGLVPRNMVRENERNDTQAMQVAPRKGLSTTILGACLFIFR